MEQDEMIERDLTLTVQLPGGQEKSVTVHGSKPVMDLLVTLCGQYHLNPSDHTVELISTNQNQIKFKPNSLIGSLEAERVVLRPKGSNASWRRASSMPVATVRLMINYRTSHKAVVRINPRVPLSELLPAICDKCEFDPSTTVLLRNSQSESHLDLTKTLNDYGIRDVYAKDTKVVTNIAKDPTTPTHKGEDEKLVTREKGQREKEDRGILGLFRKSKKTALEGGSNSISVPTSPLQNNQHTNNISCTSPTSTLPSDMTKKRRAPQPPGMAGSQSFPCGLNSSQSATLLNGTSSEKQALLSHASSAESSLKRTKRRAPPPPCTSILDSSDKVGASLASVVETQVEDDVPLYLNDSHSDQYDDPATDGWPLPSPSLMSEILSEFKDKMKPIEDGEVSSDSSVTYLLPAVSHSPKLQSVPGSPASAGDSSPMVPPSRGLLRHCPQKEGLTTFTVVPQRRQSTRKQYEVVITMEVPNTSEMCGDHTEILDPAPKEAEVVEMGGNELEFMKLKESEDLEMIEKDDDSGNPEEGRCELGTREVRENAFSKLQLNANTETCLVEETEVGEDLDEDEDEDRDWIAVYRERRKRFQTDHDGRNPKKLDGWTRKLNGLSYRMLEDVSEEVEHGFPKPPPSHYWEEEEEEAEKETREEGERKKKYGKHREDDDNDLDASCILPKVFSCDLHCDPVAAVTKVPDPYWDVSTSSKLQSSFCKLDSAAPAPTYQPPDHFTSKLDPNPTFSKRGPESAPTTSPVSPCTPPSPGTVSLFALAVSRKVEGMRKDVYNLMPTSQEFYSQTKSTQGFGSRPCPIKDPALKPSPLEGAGIKPHSTESSDPKPRLLEGLAVKPHPLEDVAVNHHSVKDSILKPHSPKLTPLNM